MKASGGEFFVSLINANGEGFLVALFAIFDFSAYNYLVLTIPLQQLSYVVGLVFGLCCDFFFGEDRKIGDIIKSECTCVSTCSCRLAVRLSGYL